MVDTNSATSTWLNSELRDAVPGNCPDRPCNEGKFPERSSLHMSLSREELQELIQSELESSVNHIDDLLLRRLQEAFHCCDLRSRSPSKTSSTPLTFLGNKARCAQAHEPQLQSSSPVPSDLMSKKKTQVHELQPVASLNVPQVRSRLVGAFVKEAQHVHHVRQHKNHRIPKQIDREPQTSVADNVPEEGGTQVTGFDEIVPLPNGESPMSVKWACKRTVTSLMPLARETGSLELTGLNRCESFVRSNSYDIIVALVVSLNAIIMGVQIHWEAVHKTKNSPSIFRIMEVCFCVAFVSELCCRCWVYRWELVTGPDWHWNSFDFLLVGLQVFEEFVAVVSSATSLPSLASLRILRIMRLLRVMRFVRIMRLLGELRILIIAIASSLKSLLWTLVLIALNIYICALVFTQIVTDHRVSNSSETASDRIQEVDRMFGSVPRSALTLFQAITGGDWREMSEPMDIELGWWVNLMFIAYIGFMVLALMNVVTGVFVDSAVNKTQEHGDLFMINNVREVFGDLSHLMSWDEFESKMALPSMIRYFKYLDVDSASARGLFSLLDANNTGSIDAEEFLASCLRLKGPAKALDMQILMKEVEGIWTEVHHMIRLMERVLGIEDRLPVESVMTPQQTIEWVV